MQSASTVPRDTNSRREWVPEYGTWKIETFAKRFLKQNKRLPNPRKPLAYWLFRRATDGARTRDLHLGKVAYYQLYYYRIHYLLFIRTINTIQYIYQLVKYIFNFICRTFLPVFAYYSVKIIFCLINRKLIESPQKVEQNFFIFSLTIPSLYGIVDIVLMNTI